MARFLDLEYSIEHPGVVRAEKVVATFKDIAAQPGATRGMAASLLAVAVVVVSVLAM